MRPASRIYDLFHGALECATEDRQAWLRAACGEDESLYRSVCGLLEADAANSHVLQPHLVTRGNGARLVDQLLSELECPAIPGYDSVRFLDRGGQGRVYQAKQISTGQQVAIKVLPLAGRETQGQRQAVIRFQQEAHVLARLDHPHIVRVIDQGRAADGRQYLITEFIQGERLDQHVLQRCTEGFSAVEHIRHVVKLMIEVTRSVGAAHQLHIIHRDLKPQNILVDTHGVPRVLDFGIAKLLGETERREQLTHTGDFVGTHAWASPEQLPGSALTIGPAADIYSLGLLLYHLLTLGGFPYPVDGELSAVLHHIARVPAKSLEAPVIVSQRTHCVPLWITALPRISRVLLEDLNGVLQRTLQKDPAQRYPDASSLTRELESVLSTHFGNRGLTRRHWLIAGSAGAFGFVGAAAWGARHARERRIYEVRSVPVAGAETKSRQTALSLEPMATASVPGPVRALVASTDGQWVACAGMATQDSGFAGLWSVTESQPRWLHTEKLPPLAALVFDEPRGMLLGAGHDGYFYAWQLESGTLQEKLRLYDSSLCMDREAGTGELVIGSRSGHVQILSTDSYQQRAKLHVCAEHMRSVRFCGGADRIIAGCDAGAIYLIDATSGESLDRVESLGGIVASLSVAPSGNRVVAALYEGWIFSFDAKNLNDMREANVEQQLHSVYAADQWAVAVGTSERVEFFSSDLASRVTLAMGSRTETTTIALCGRDEYFLTGGHDGVLRYFHASDVLAKLSFLGERASA